MSSNAAGPAPDVKVERKPPKDPEEALMRYTEAVEKMGIGFTDIPRYHVEFNWKREAAGIVTVKLSAQVNSHREILDELYAFSAVIVDYMEGKE